MPSREPGDEQLNPKPCTRCGHKARDHSPRSTKKDSWFTKCKKENCGCEQYKAEVLDLVIM